MKNFRYRTAFLLFAIFSISVISYGQKQAAVQNKEKNIVLFSNLKYIDIGKETKQGSETINKNELKLVAGGADIWGRHDEFRFGYMDVQGDFDFTIQVLSLSAAHKYTKAGLMAREGLSDSSRHIYYQVFPDNSERNKNNGGCEFQYRSIEGGSMKAIYPEPLSVSNEFKVSYPDTFIRLMRKGDLFESYFSNDNKSWKLYASFTLKMADKLLVGPAVTSHNKNDFTTAGFASFQFFK